MARDRSGRSHHRGTAVKEIAFFLLLLIVLYFIGYAIGYFS